MGNIIASTLFDRKLIEAASGAAAHARGLGYFGKGRVAVKAADEKRVVAVVSGAEDYRVELSAGGGALSGTCTCRARQDRDVCKHMVAAALAANDLTQGKHGAPVQKKSVIDAFLETLPRERLISIISELANSHPEIETALELAAMAGSSDSGEALAFFRRALKKSIKVRGFVEYREARAWAKGVEDVLDAIAPLAQEGYAAAALTLTEEALELVSEAAMSMDDSDGHAGGLIWKIRDLHAAAAEAVKPEPRAFAARLVDMVSSIDLFEASEVVGVYADVLGAEGLAELERLALAGLDQLPLRPKAAGYVKEVNGVSRWSLTHLAEDCAKLRGDIDAQLALKRRDLGTAYDYLGIVELLSKHDRKEEALKWARDGMIVFEDNPDERLTLACAGLLDEAGERADAAKLLWKEFAAHPSDRLYASLAARSDNAERRAVTDQAISLLDARLAQSVPPARHDYVIKPLMLAILTIEERYAEAWALAGRLGIPMTSREAETLADKSAELFPEKAARVWHEKIEAWLRLGGNQNYKGAHALVQRRKARGARRKAGRTRRLSGRSADPPQSKAQLHPAFRLKRTAERCGLRPCPTARTGA
jgi:uncharacterized Zn finger protein